MRPLHINKTVYKDERARRRARRRFLYRLRQRVIELGVLAVLVTLVAVPISLLTRREPAPSESTAEVPSATQPAKEPIPYPELNESTIPFGAEVDAQYALLWDVTDNRVIAAKGADVVTYPASVTKVMTLLVAVEHIDDFTDTFTMTYDILHPLYLNNATIAGFVEGEAVLLEDLLYGTILPSGADASQALAEYVAGSEAAFAELMNEKAAELGLKNTHFVNTSGLHDKDHYTTAADMAVVLRAAMENVHCRQVLSTYQYTTAVTPEHPEGILLTSTLFSRIYGDEPDGATIVAGKTGYTSQAVHTLVTYAQGENGHEYVFVTLKGSDRWKIIYDAIDTYTRFCGTKEIGATPSSTG